MLATLALPRFSRNETPTKGMLFLHMVEVLLLQPATCRFDANLGIPGFPGFVNESASGCLCWL